MGHLFILDRRTGVPLVPVTEEPVPASDVPGERAAPTQPFPPPAYRFAPESLSAADAFGVTDSTRAACRARLAALRFQGVFTPPSLQGTILWPGDIGGMSWSGVSVDEARGILVAPINRLAMVVRLIPRDSLHAAYMAHPDLEYGRQTGTPYAMSRGDLGTCTPPPWGTLVGFDLARGAVKWQVPVGWMPQFAAVKDGRSWGSVNLGGALVTRGGLVFVAGTYDQHLRAFDIETGRELWSTPLPAGANALPMSYAASGRQYIVVAAGGHDRLHTTMGDYVLAFALPGRGAPVPDTAPGRLAGSWKGEMHIGNARFGMHVTLGGTGDSVATAVRMDSVTITGPVVVHRSGRTVTISLPLLYPAKHACTATITTALSLWNGGTLLEGGGSFRWAVRRPRPPGRRLRLPAPIGLEAGNPNGQRLERRISSLLSPLSLRAQRVVARSGARSSVPESSSRRPSTPARSSESSASWRLALALWPLRRRRAKRQMCSSGSGWRTRPLRTERNRSTV